MQQISLHFTLGEPAVNGWIYFHVEDVDELYDWYKSHGVRVLAPPTTEPWGMREINVVDLNGYSLRFGQSDMSFGDPIPVQRVDVTARLETRLAALVADLAAHKKMTVTQCLEETLLHTLEPLPQRAGEGVASPHTRRTMEHIQELKKRHGIDYEMHDAYRFVEE